LFFRTPSKQPTSKPVKDLRERASFEQQRKLDAHIRRRSSIVLLPDSPNLAGIIHQVHLQDAFSLFLLRAFLVEPDAVEPEDGAVKEKESTEFVIVRAVGVRSCGSCRASGRRGALGGEGVVGQGDRGCQGTKVGFVVFLKVQRFALVSSEWSNKPRNRPTLVNSSASEIVNLRP